MQTTLWVMSPCWRQGSTYGATSLWASSSSGFLPGPRDANVDSHGPAAPAAAVSLRAMRPALPGVRRRRGATKMARPGFGHHPAFVEARAPRVSCPEHGVVVAQVPWADHDARFTRVFEE